ncbi:MAG: fumarate hydratase [Clostridia bacterium]|nr:fumarate hydratase [Clostridia bacterium]
MRVITAKEIENTVCDLFKKAAIKLPPDVYKSMKKARREEENLRASSVLCKLCDNACVAEKSGVPICQDTGLAFVFAEIGQDVHIEGDFEKAVNRGVKRAYVGGKLRLSVADPLTRKNTGTNTPAIIYTSLVKGDKLKITAMPKGFGSENMSALKMFNPTASTEDIKAFVTDTVLKAGANPCPPIIVGVGIGGSFDYCAYLAKKALIRPVGKYNKTHKVLEAELLEQINQTGIGPQGFGGKTTCLWVAVESAPTHIAGLPVAVNISCHATRHADAVL